MQVRSETASTENNNQVLSLQLMIAIRDRNVSEIKRLVAAGADLAVLDDKHKTPIEYAAQCGYWECVTAIAMSKKTDANDTYRYSSALITAAVAGKSSVMKDLLTAGASPNTMTKNDDSLLHWAIDVDNSMIEPLIQYGIDLSLLNKKGRTPIQHAADKKNWACIKRIAQCKNADLDDAYGYGSGVIYAVWYAENDVVEDLLKAGATTQARFTNTLETPLHVAVVRGNPAAATLLIQYGADLAAVNNSKKTPMQVAVSLQNWEMIELLARNVKTTAGDSYNYNDAFIAAAKANKMSTVNILLDAGAPAMGDIGGETLLHRAIRENNADLIVKLIKNNADLAAVNSNKQTAMDYAVSLGKWNFVGLIALHKKNDEKDSYHYGAALSAAVYKNRKSTVDILLDSGAMNHAKHDIKLKRIVHDAIDYASPDMLPHLLKHDADLAELDSYGHTPIEHALNNNDWERVKLIATSRKTNDKDTYHYGHALESAVYHNKYNDAKYLLEAGARTTWARDKDTVLHSAVKNRNTEMIKLLLKHNANLAAVDAGIKKSIGLAVELGYIDCVNAIIQTKSTDENDTYHYGVAAVAGLRKGYSRTLIKSFIRAGACNTPNSRNKLFATAVSLEKIEIAGDVLEAGADINAMNAANGGMPLHIAVNNHDLPMLRFLLTHHANQTVLNRSKQTPIEQAAELGYWDCVQLLLEFDHNDGNDKQLLTDMHLEQALLIAIKKSNYAAVKMLLEHHAPFDRCDLECGNIALYWAVKNNAHNPEIVSLLLEYGIDASVKNKDGKTMATLAKEWGHTACFQYLNNYRSIVKPGKAADEYRREADALYQSMRLNTHQPEELPAKIKMLHACHQALLKCDLEALIKRREALSEKKESNDGSNELDSINCTIMAINTLLNFPDKSLSPTLLRKGAVVEGKDVNDCVQRKIQTDQYFLRVRTHLQQLNSAINQHEWRVKGPFGLWVRGTPRHIRPLRAELSKLAHAVSADDVYQIFIEVMKIFASIDKLSYRHEDTTYFYDTHARSIKALSFTSLVDEQRSINSPVYSHEPVIHVNELTAQTIASKDMPANYQSVYPAINGSEISYPTEQIAPAVVESQPVALPASPVVATGVLIDLTPSPVWPSGDLIDLSVPQLHHLPPAPTGPLEDADAALPALPDVPPRKVASALSIFSQPAATQTDDAGAVKKEKKVEKKTAVLC